MCKRERRVDVSIPKSIQSREITAARFDRPLASLCQEGCALHHESHPPATRSLHRSSDIPLYQLPRPKSDSRLLGLRSAPARLTLILVAAHKQRPGSWSPQILPSRGSYETRIDNEVIGIPRTYGRAPR